jgi:hypothetical protein
MKINNLIKHSIFALAVLILSACGMDETEPYDVRYIHIMKDEASTTSVNVKANSVASYYVYLSSALALDTVEVVYQMNVGNGLQEGLDFKRVTTSDTLQFLPGIFAMPVRIQWLPNQNLDWSNDNSIKIALVSNNKGYAIGFPGPMHNQSVLTINKIK